MKEYICIKCKRIKAITDFEHKKGNKHRNRKCNDCTVEVKPKSLLKGKKRIDAENETKIFNQANTIW